RIVALSVARIVMLPAVADTLVAFAMYASTVFAIRLCASETPIESDTAPAPAKEAAREAAAATAAIVDVSAALRLTECVVIPAAPAPSMYAFVTMPMRLSALTPEPERPTPP